MDELVDSSDLVGKVVLAGLTYFDSAGRLLRQRQVHGKIESISPRGIFISIEGGETFVLPPDVHALRKAPPGRFREHGSGQSIDDPDLITMWQFRQVHQDGEIKWRALHTPIDFPRDEAK